MKSIIHLCFRMLPGLGGEGAFAAVEIEKPDVVRFHGASEVRDWTSRFK